MTPHRVLFMRAMRKEAMKRHRVVDVVVVAAAADAEIAVEKHPPQANRGALPQIAPALSARAVGVAWTTPWKTRTSSVLAMILGANQRALKMRSSGSETSSTKIAMAVQKNCRPMERSYDAPRADVVADGAGAKGIASRAKCQMKYQPLAPQDVDARCPRGQALPHAMRMI